jgi:hypothetical protein
MSEIEVTENGIPGNEQTGVSTIDSPALTLRHVVRRIAPLPYDGSGAAARDREDGLPEWLTHHVARGTNRYAARFPWELTVFGVPVQCGQLLWEQFVTGGFTIRFADGSSKFFSTADTMRRINPSTRQFGAWTDDILPGMTPGPRALNTYGGASCTGGVTRPQANPRGTMRGASADPRGGVYRFEDAPGFSKNFGDAIGGKVFVGISWAVSFEQKLWRAGDASPFYRIRFSLGGTADRQGTDTRSIC